MNIKHEINSPIPTAKIRSQKVDNNNTVNIIRTSELSLIGPRETSFGKTGIAFRPL